MYYYIGFVWVFNFEEDVQQVIIYNYIEFGDVIFICYEGVKGFGVLEMLMIIDVIVYDKCFDGKVVLIIDGCFFGVISGLCVGYVLLEVVDGGLIVLVEDGDLIEMDVKGCKFNIVGIDGMFKIEEEICCCFEEC